MTMLQDLLHLFYPQVCSGCQQALMSGEKNICLSCLSKLPLTGYPALEDNKVARLFWGRVNLKQASSVYFFEKDAVLQNIIHELKYRGNQGLGLYLGKLMKQQLNKSDWFQSIDLIVPVPLHPKKMRKRGYNQAEMLARGIANNIIPWESLALKRLRNSESQTKKSREERWKNMHHTMCAGPQVGHIKDQHVLLVDDIITTGATLEACAHVLLENGAQSVSVCSLACTFT